MQDSTEARNRALKAAVDDAMRKARAIASAAGVRIMHLQRLQEISGSFGYYVAREMSTLEIDGEGAPTPIEAGKVVIRSNITALFEFAE